MALDETIEELLDFLKIQTPSSFQSLTVLKDGESGYIRDLKVNLTNALKSEHLSAKETALLSLAVAANANNEVLTGSFEKMAATHDATPNEISEAVACASLLASNNVFYRFRHFMGKDSYNRMPGKIKMNIMMRPALGKEFFELMSLAVSAVNGCEMCVKAHENSLIELGASENRIWDAIRLSSVITSLTKIIR